LGILEIVIMSKVSIIVPNYNHASYLPKRLESIFHQTYQDFEVILLDDCSTDNSVEVLEKYANHPKVSHFIINEENSGSPFKQWNKGVTLSKGEYIWIAESDDYADETFLEKLVPTLNQNPKVGIAYCQSHVVNENNDLIKSRISWTKSLHETRWNENFTNDGRDEVAKYLIIKNTIPNASGTLIRKQSYINAGMAPVNMKMAGDWYLYLSILNQYNIAFIKEELNYNRQHPTITRNHKTKDQSLNRLIEGCLVTNYCFKNFTINTEIKQQVKNNFTDHLISKVGKDDLLRTKFWQLVYYYSRIDHWFCLKLFIEWVRKINAKLKRDLSLLQQ